MVGFQTMKPGEAMTQTVSFHDAVLGRHRHICAFFDSRDEEYTLLLPFVREGLEQGEKAFQIVDPELQSDHLHRLQEFGIDVEQRRATRQLEVRGWQDAYLREGHFNQEAMLSLIEDILQAGPGQGFPLTRLVAHMEWALEDRPGVNDLIEYEARLNYILPRHADPVICTYDSAKFGAGAAIDILRTHPVVIMGGIMQENPFFVAPDIFLAEVRDRSLVR
jgi:hypothetical protein